ncbi:hypothetical protein E2C01_019676 [Portunus trituberculatus]|uniref:Uncharacterized protein n=1 Tax=Portunus trituberculatus TaxID=210409 RepID=A0A5B7E014_PORTR|nr:hypothetical protein [Portunus trituberculatus]
MHLPHTHMHASLKITNKKKWRLQIQRRSPFIGPQNVLIPPSTFSSLNSATFAVLDLIFNLWNTTSPLLILIFFSSLKHICLRLLTVAPSMFPPTFSILIFVLKLDVASMCATTYLALLLTLFNLQNFPSFGFDSVHLPFRGDLHPWRFQCSPPALAFLSLQ